MVYDIYLVNLLVQLIFFHYSYSWVFRVGLIGIKYFCHSTWYGYPNPLSREAEITWVSIGFWSIRISFGNVILIDFILCLIQFFNDFILSLIGISRFFGLWFLHLTFMHKQILNTDLDLCFFMITKKFRDFNFIIFVFFFWIECLMITNLISYLFISDISTFLLIF